MLEDEEARKEFEVIVSIPGIDLVNVGRGDLARALRTTTRDPRIDEFEDRVIKMCKEAGIPYMKMALWPELVEVCPQRYPHLRIFWQSTDTGQVSSVPI